MPFREHFRCAEEWISSTNGLMRLNTPSNEAAKYYDATISQLIGYYRDESIGGPAASCKLMLSSDPNFILGRALELEMKLVSPTGASRLDPRLKRSVEALNALLNDLNPDYSTQLELLHVEVVNNLAENRLKQATTSLERLITLFPEDVWAMKLLQHTYIKLGTALPMRNSLAYAVPRMSDNNPLKGFARGLYAFALEESNMYQMARAEALTALEMNPNDTWAIHSYAHCFEMLGQVEEGLRWMEDQECNWLPCQTLASHQLWHKALFQINNEQFDEAVFLLDTEILPRCKQSPIPQDWISASSLLYRMELINLIGQVRTRRDDNPERWSIIYEMCKPHEKDHLWGFYDANYMMSYLGMDDLATAEEFINTIDDRECTLNEGKSVVKPLLQAMLDYKLKQYERCAEKLIELRHDIIKIGGSHAQRDVFDQLLVVAAQKSPNAEHNRFSERMLYERDSFAGRRLPLVDHLKLAY